MTDDWGEVSTSDWGTNVKTTGPTADQKPVAKRPKPVSQKTNEKITNRIDKIPPQTKKKRNRNKFKPDYEPKKPKIHEEKVIQNSKPKKSAAFLQKPKLEETPMKKQFNNKHNNKRTEKGEKKKRVRKSRNKFKMNEEERKETGEISQEKVVEDGENKEDVEDPIENNRYYTI